MSEIKAAIRWALDQPNSNYYIAGYRARTKDPGRDYGDRDFTDANDWIVSEYQTAKPSEESS
ncbi:hypothetical protein [Rhodococcus qingshengii]|uniref:hypothetical protein n=1 Tax=Rhodococcus qingshengii TaxID=334542 RepID=UPI001ADFB748|nr:hypothetical protein [Rhodococcus qingshengii]MCQ4148704.1 hypothetical protein [Rhodococcus qingshengii]